MLGFCVFFLQVRVIRYHFSGALAGWATEADKFCITVRVLTMDRPASLRRLLSSLLDAKYENDKVDLEVHVDIPRAGNNTLYIDTILLLQCIGLMGFSQYTGTQLVLAFSDNGSSHFARERAIVSWYWKMT